MARYTATEIALIKDAIKKGMVIYKSVPRKVVVDGMTAILPASTHEGEPRYDSFSMRGKAHKQATQADPSLELFFSANDPAQVRQFNEYVQEQKDAAKAEAKAKEEAIAEAKARLGAKAAKTTAPVNPIGVPPLTNERVLPAATHEAMQDNSLANEKLAELANAANEPAFDISKHELTAEPAKVSRGRAKGKANG